MGSGNLRICILLKLIGIQFGIKFNINITVFNKLHFIITRLFTYWSIRMYSPIGALQH